MDSISLNSTASLKPSIPLLRSHVSALDFGTIHGVASLAPFAIAIILCLWLLLGRNSKEAQYPWGLKHMRYTPRWWCGHRWATASREVMAEACKKFKNRAYRVIRHDVDLIMLPASAVDEVAALPNDLASNLHALEFDLASHFTGLGHLRNAHLHARFVHRKITPNLPKLAAGIEEEVDRAIEHFFGDSIMEWTEFSPYPFLTYISSRVSARIMLGKDYAHHREWLNVAQKFTENFLGSVTIMRYCPRFMLPILKWSLPTVWATARYIRDAERILIPEFSKLLDLSNQGNWKPSEQEEKWGMEWLVHLATGEERDPKVLVYAEILLILASIPTTVFSEANVLLDLISHPELVNQVRTEIEEVAKEEWSFSSYGKLYKLDSILRESQRLAPPTIIGLRRIMRKEYELSSGIVLPKGAYVCVPTYSIQNDTANTKNPQEYDGLRSYRRRLDGSGQVQSTKHQFTTTETTVLGFGHGRTACPGRYLASVALKIIVSKLITRFDFRFPNGQTTRPPNTIAHEFLVAPQDAKVLLRRCAPSESQR